MKNSNATFDPVWEEVHQKRSWGRYPSEDVIRFTMRNFRSMDPATIRFLDLGCGNGANTWFLRREGFVVHGIDGSGSALRRATEFLGQEGPVPPLCQGDAGSLPYADRAFHCIIDSVVLSANTSTGISRILRECHRVLRPEGLLFSSGLFSPATTGFGTGQSLEEGTFRNVTQGPLSGLGTVHFFERHELDTLWGENGFSLDSVDHLTRTDNNGQVQVSYYLVLARKKNV